jgi:broad specificity phosphatase PhoE
LVGSRRGLDAYLDDLKKQVISYREYDFTTNPYSEKKQTFQIDDRHQKEYAYHVLKFLQLNLIKILFQSNKRYSISELTEIFSSLNYSFKNHSDFLIELHKWKYENAIEPERIFIRLENFIKDLSNWLNNLNLPKLSFFRHAKTELNDGTFLGVRRNPSITKPIQILSEDYFDEVYTGTLNRTVETGELLKAKEFHHDALLNEIDYGLVEGLKVDELDEKFPNLLKSWQNNEDPKFPEGESQLDVSNRLQDFIKKGFTKKNTAVVTHNVVLRTLIGKVYNQQVHNWYKINPNHLEAYDFQIFNDTLIPLFTKEQQLRFKDQITGIKPISKYGIFWIPNQELIEYIETWKNEIRKFEPDAIYLDHPVHTTIFLFNALDQELTEIISKFENKEINFLIDSWKIFENDLVTKCDTITLALKPTSSVISFQKAIADSLLSFVKKPIVYPNLWEGKYKYSYEKYGFPFVGNHWIPHLTIASVKKEGKHLIKEIKSTKIDLIQKEFSGKLALFKITGDSHQIIHSWK